MESVSYGTCHPSSPFQKKPKGSVTHAERRKLAATKGILLPITIVLGYRSSLESTNWPTTVSSPINPLSRF
ncbi:uncharacterized protein G2W53_000911 [Senna tora]|uniref:Uncharacterized protein n=1 Tax=Senna tora TaxID=362788 RepID=A0A835CJW6_9FABA|nr:uncharacterized protein G2W53_000911 [Senna tora]